MKQSIVANKAFEFSFAIIQITKILPKNYENIVIIKQVIRSATSIGANTEEALGGNTPKEFTHCMNIAKKEARETRYWLKLLVRLHEQETEILSKTENLLVKNEEIISILTSIVKTSGINL